MAGDLAAADSSAAVGVDSAGVGLAQVERDLASIHVNPTSSGDSSSAGQLGHGYLNPKYKIGDLARQAYRDKWPTTAEDRIWLDNIRKEWPEAGRLTDQELLALERFVSSDGALINTALRTGDGAALAEVEPELRNLSSALNKLPNYRGHTVRAIDVPPREPGFTVASKDGPYRGNVRIIVYSVEGKDISPVVPGLGRVSYSAGEVFRTVERVFDPVARVWNITVDDLGR